jgi:hypothetical protein
MPSLFRFFVRLTPLILLRLTFSIFILFALGLFFGIRHLVKARNEMRKAAFGLEREIANRHKNQAISALVLVGFLGFAGFFMVVFLVPNFPALSQFATTTMNPLSTPTSTFALQFIETMSAETPGSTATAQATGCIPGQIDITSPKPGDEIQGLIVMKGSANIPNFGFYKYEFATIGSDTWATILANRKVVQDGDLGNWDTSAITTGDYQLRLVVTDNQGNELPACVIPIRIKTR